MYDYLLFDADKCKYDAGLGFHVKVKRSRVSNAAGEVDIRDLIETNVHRRLIEEDEPALQRIEGASGRLVRTPNRSTAAVAVNEVIQSS